jgi:hypothetical protein
MNGQKKWSREKIREDILYLSRKGVSLNAGEVCQTHPALFSAANSKHYFGGWGEAVNEAGFDYEKIKKRARQRVIERLRCWSRKKIIEEIRKLSLEEITPVYERHLGLYSAARREFGNFREALKAAGLENTQRTYIKWSEDKVREEILSLKENGLGLVNVAKNRPLLYSAALRIYGNWVRALEFAGIEYTLLREDLARKKWNEGKVIEEIRKLRRKGEKLNSGYVQQNHSALFAAANRECGNWRGALEKAGI